MKELFLFSAFIVTALSVICVFISKSHKTRVAKYIMRLHTMAALSLFFAVVPVFVADKTVATVFISLYYASIDWYLFTFVDFLFSFTDTPFDAPLIRIFRTDFKILSIADSFLIMSTVITNFTFSLTNAVSDGILTIWKETKCSGFRVHEIFDYIVTAFILFFLVKKLVTVARFHKQKIVVVLACFIVMMMINISFMLVGPDYRFSVIFYGILSLCINYVALTLVPLKLNLRIKELIAENISDAVACFDTVGRCIFMNRSAHRLFKNEDECCEKLSAYGIEDASNLTERKFTDEFEIEGKTRHFNVVLKNLNDKKNRRIGTYLVYSDITHEIDMIQKEKFLSSHDSLSRFYNRSTFFKKMDEILQTDPHVSRYLICTNIKNFKLLNDRFGSQYGDRILKMQAGLFRDMLTHIGDGTIIEDSQSADCIIGRISGDRFGILIRKDDYRANDLQSDMIKIQKAACIGKYKLRMLAGIYEINRENAYYESVYSMYDKCTLAIKNVSDEYEKVIHFYDSTLMEKLKHERKIISMFENALENHEFCMYLQPQVSSKSQNAVGAEALVRWQSKEGMIPPSDFVPVLENASLIHKLDRYIWGEAVRKLAEWEKRGIDMYIAVNISVKDFYYLDLYKEFTSLVEEYGISPENLKLEITETVLMHDMKMHTQVLESLRQYGFFIEMDDFGSGYSSLSMLKNIKMDILKIDMAFLKKSRNQERSRTIIKSIIWMAKELGMKIVTEGVEETSQVDFLTDIGCDIFQGYFYSRPICVAEFEKRFMNSSLGSQNDSADESTNETTEGDAE